MARTVKSLERGARRFSPVLARSGCPAVHHDPCPVGVSSWAAMHPKYIFWGSPTGGLDGAAIADVAATGLDGLVAY